MNDGRIAVVVDIRRLNRVCDELTPFTNRTDKIDLLRYILSKEYSYDLGDWDHHWVSRYVLALHENCRRVGGVKIDMPPGVVSIEEIKISKQAAYITCIGHAEVFNTDRTIRPKNTPLRSGIHREDRSVGDRVYSSGMGKRVPISEDRIRRLLGL